MTIIIITAHIHAFCKVILVFNMPKIYQVSQTLCHHPKHSTDMNYTETEQG